MSSRHGPWAVVLATLVLQFALQAHVFPFSALSSAEPLLYIDSGFHQYQMEVARQLCAEGRVSGYDPMFAAGQVGGLVVNASAKLQAVLACLAGTADAVPVVYKHISFWQGVAAPALVAAAAAMLGLSPAATVVAAVLAIFGWWTGGMRWYHTAGMVSYVISAYLTLPFVVAAVATCLRPTAWRVGALAAVAAVGMWIHPLFPLGALLVFVPMLLWQLRTAREARQTAAVLAAAALAMVALNYSWLIGSMQLLGNVTYQQPYQREVQPALPLLEMLGRASTAGGGLRLGLALVLGTGLCIWLFRGRQRAALLGAAAGAALLMAWAALAAAVPALATLQPNRYSAMHWLFLILPASAGLVAAPAAWAAAAPTRRRLMMAMLGVASMVTAFAAWETAREIFGGPLIGRYAVAPPEVKGQGPVSRQIDAFLKTQDSEGGRVLFETSMARIHDNAHMAGPCALTAGREFIGGAYPHMDGASAWDGFALGGAHAGRSASELTRLLDAYNLRWMLCHSDSCKQAMQGLSDTVAVGQFGPVTAFQRQSSPGFVVQGSGRVVESCVNRVRVDGASGSPLVLRYHWVPGLRSEPSGRVEPVVLVPGARPFVAIFDPPSSLVLRIGAGPGRACSDRADARLALDSQLSLGLTSR